MFGNLRVGNGERLVMASKTRNARNMGEPVLSRLNLSSLLRSESV